MNDSGNTNDDSNSDDENGNAESLKLIDDTSPSTSSSASVNSKTENQKQIFASKLSDNEKKETEGQDQLVVSKAIENVKNDSQAVDGGEKMNSKQRALRKTRAEEQFFSAAADYMANARRSANSTASVSGTEMTSDIDAFATYVKSALNAISDPLVRERTVMDIQQSLFNAKMSMLQSAQTSVRNANQQPTKRRRLMLDVCDRIDYEKDVAENENLSQEDSDRESERSTSSVRNAAKKAGKATLGW
jgi:hypothetical protein